jgi:hypothetical protein
MPSIMASEGNSPGPKPNIARPRVCIVELDDAVRHHQRVVVGQRDDPGAETDPAGALSSGGDEQLGLAIDLVAAGMVLADPRLGVVVLVEPLHELEIALHAKQRVLVVGMERRQEHSRAKGAILGHAAPPSIEDGTRYYRTPRLLRTALLRGDSHKSKSEDRRSDKLTAYREHGSNNLQDGGC